MKRCFPSLLKLVFLFLMLNSCKTPEAEFVKTEGPEVVPLRVITFELTDVRLLDGPFKHATDLDLKILLGYEPDRLLAKFYFEAGLCAFRTINIRFTFGFINFISESS